MLTLFHDYVKDVVTMVKLTIGRVARWTQGFLENQKEDGWEAIHYALVRRLANLVPWEENEDLVAIKWRFEKC